MSETLIALFIAFLGAFVGAWLSVYLTGLAERRREKEVSAQCVAALREVTKTNIENIQVINGILKGESLPPNRVIPSLQSSIYEALLPLMPSVGVSHGLMVEVAKTYGYVRDYQQLHYTVLQLGLQQNTRMRDGLVGSEVGFAAETTEQLKSLEETLQKTEE